jgi:hypothetical protein
MVDLKDEPKSLGKWVVVYDRQLIGTYDSFDAAAEDAVRITAALMSNPTLFSARPRRRSPRAGGGNR